MNVKRLSVLNATITLTCLFAALSCSSNVEPASHCFQEDNRKIIETVTNVTAIILGPEGQDCPKDFIIEPDDDLPNNILGLLSPCNLEENFQTHGLRVQVSGFIYESSDTEDICADFFEITEISVTSN